MAGATTTGGTGVEPQPDPPSSLAYYVEPVAGDDANPGTEALPFKTIAHAASLAIDGDTIWLEDGSYDWQSEPSFRDDVTIHLAHGVQLRAVTPGFVRLFSKVDHFGDGGFALAGDAQLAGLHFVGFNPALRADRGLVVLDDVSFESPWDTGICNYGKQALIMLSGTAKTTLRFDEGGGFQGYGKCLARLDDDATLDVQGGQISGAGWESPPDYFAVFSTWGRSRLHIDGLTAQDNLLPIIGAWDSSVVSVEHASMQGGALEVDRAPPLVHVADSASLSVQSTWFDGADLQCCLCATSVAEHEGAAATVALKDVAMSHCVRAITLTANSDVRLDNVNLSDNSGALFIRGGKGGGSLRVAQSRVANNAQHGIELDAGLGDFSVTLRGTTVTHNTGDGIRVGRTPSIGGVLRLDLGTFPENGFNVLRANGRDLVGSVNLRLLDDLASELFAVGNTWDGSTQGSDSGGGYYPNGADATTYDADRQLHGTNYAFEGASSGTVTLRLAERAPF